MIKSIGIAVAVMLSGCGGADMPIEESESSILGETPTGLLKSYVCTGMADFGDSAYRVEHLIYVYPESIMTVCSVADSSGERAKTYAYRPNQSGFQNAACDVRFDTDTASYGKFNFTFNSYGAKSTVNYADSYSDRVIFNPVFNCQQF